jgi:3-hydroxyisobutyrate dehydrogenase-like beta-hydroxyacid dehydrogenase
MTTTIGFVGLGGQGRPIAQRIIAAGYSTFLYARRPQTLEPFRGSPATIAGSLRELGARSEIAFICVVDDAQVEEVMTGQHLLAGMAPGSIVVILSTVHPKSCQRMAALAAGRGVAVVDAPVSGGGRAAAQGGLTIMAGGDEAAYERCLPILKTFGSNIQDLGPVGMGSAGKLVNNFLFTGNLLLGEAALALGTRAGIPKDRLVSFLSTGSGRSFALSAVQGLLGGATRETHGVQLLRKDVELARRMAEGLGVALGDLEWVARRLERGP